MRLTIIGCGDAFGAGGQLQTSFHVTSNNTTFLIDCGVTTLIGMNRLGLATNDVDMVCVSHLHGDHFGGLPFLVLDGQFSRRTTPLVVAGPPGVRDRVERTMEVLFPGSSQVQRRFAVEYVELQERAPVTVVGATVTGFPVVHASGAPPFALRVQYGGRTIVYSGDTQWTETLIEAARDADCFVCEAYTFDRVLPFHLDYATVRAHPVGLRSPDGEQLITAACPPAFPSMAEAVRTIVDAKFGKDGVYTDRDVFARIYREDYGQRYLTEAGEYDDRVVECARDVCAYVLRTHGRFPAHTDAIHVPGVWLQVHHVENEYYERFFTNGLTDAHRTHAGAWGH